VKECRALVEGPMRSFVITDATVPRQHIER
jgi:hypothetical protein